jgi:hypothetical protein
MPDKIIRRFRIFKRIKAMSDPKVNGSSSDQTSDINVDDLLSDIKQMADHVEELIGKEEEKKPPLPEPLPEAKTTGGETPPESDPAEDLAQMDQMASREAEKIPQEDPAFHPPEESSDPSIPTFENSAPPTDQEPQPEIQVDENTAQIADDEINEALGQLTQKQQEINENPDVMGENSLTVEDLPGPVKAFIQFLSIVDRPFLWLPCPIKDLLGYIGLATFLLAVILWTLIFMTGKK